MEKREAESAREAIVMQAKDIITQELAEEMSDSSIVGLAEWVITKEFDEEVKTDTPRDMEEIMDQGLEMGSKIRYLNEFHIIAYELAEKEPSGEPAEYSSEDIEI